MAWSANRLFALVLGIVFVLIGILGLLTANSSTSNLLGIFGVDLLHNLVHLITGIIAIAAAYMGFSRRFNQVFGVIYLLLGLAGLIPALYSGAGGMQFLGIIHINPADNVLHLLAGAAAIIIGFFVTETARTRTAL